MASAAIPLGILLSFIATCCVLFNFSMLITLWRGSFLSSKHGGIYLLAFAHIFGGMITASLVAFYLGPSIIAQSTLFETLTVPQILGFVFHAQWFQDMLLQFVTAMNRWLVIVYPRTAAFFTRGRTIGIIAIVYIVGILLGILTSYFMPCCPIFVYYKVFTFAYLRTEFNIADFAVDLPINISCSLIAVFCYWRIYVYVHTSNSQISSVLSQKEASTRKNRETKYALQFAACTGFCIFAWISFRIIPLLVPINLAEIFMVVTILELCHCISNSFVFFMFNAEIRRHFLSAITKSSYEHSTQPHYNVNAVSTTGAPFVA